MRVGPSFAFWKFPWKYDPPGGFKSCQLHETGKFPGNLTSLGDFPAPGAISSGLEQFRERVGADLERFWNALESWERFGVVLEQFWTVLDRFGGVLEQSRHKSRLR